MRIVKLLVALVAVAAGLLFGAGRLGLLEGRRPADLGATDGRLKAPSATENSVSSQADPAAGPGAAYARIAPLSYEGDAAAAMQRLQAIVAAMPGARVVQTAPNYLYAEFTSKWLRFVDDVEFLAVPGSDVIHVRSASRLGRRDMGVNRARIEAIRSRFAAAPAPTRP
jgi:uncharacterized protein (DUF1499 family)